MCCYYYTGNSYTDISCFNHTRSITPVPPNAVTVPHVDIMAFLQLLIIKYFTMCQWMLVYADIILEKLVYFDLQLTV